MAAPPKPPQSVVFKTKKPTKAQNAQKAAAKATPKLGAPGVGGASMNKLYDLYNHGPVAPAAPPVKTGKHGLVSSPAAGAASLTAGVKAKPLPNAPVHKKPVKVVVHTDGRIEVHTTAHPAAVPSHLPANAPAGHAATDVHTTPPKTKVKPKPLGAALASAAPPPNDFTTAQTQAAALLDPVEQRISDMINKRTGAQQTAITGYTGELAKLYGLYAGQAGDAYNTAIGSEASVNDALANRLGGVTSETGTDLAAKLKAIEADPATAARVAGDVQAAGTGAGNAGFALGSADLSALIGKKADARNYGAKLPGLAGLYGLQATKQAQGQATTELSTALTSLAQTEPGLVQSLLSGIRSDRNTQAQLDFERKQFGVKTKQAQQSLDNQTATAISNLYGVDANGNLTLAGRRVAALETKARAALKGSGKNKPMTKAQQSQIAQKAAKDADTFYHGVAPTLYQGQPVAGTGTPPVQYPEALRRLMAKYPGLTVARATKILNSFYAPGEGGRPAFTKKQQEANAIAFPDPFATLPIASGG